MSSEHGVELNATKTGLDDDSLMFDQSIKQEDNDSQDIVEGGMKKPPLIDVDEQSHHSRYEKMTLEKKEERLMSKMTKVEDLLRVSRDNAVQENQTDLD